MSWDTYVNPDGISLPASLIIYSWNQGWKGTFLYATSFSYRGCELLPQLLHNPHTYLYFSPQRWEKRNASTKIRLNYLVLSISVSSSSPAVLPWGCSLFTLPVTDVVQSLAYGSPHLSLTCPAGTTATASCGHQHCCFLMLLFFGLLSVLLRLWDRVFVYCWATTTN